MMKKISGAVAVFAATSALIAPTQAFASSAPADPTCGAYPGLTRSSNGKQIVFSGYFECGDSWGKYVEVQAYMGDPHIQNFQSKTMRTCDGGARCDGYPYSMPDAPGEQTYCTIVSGREANYAPTLGKYCRVL